VRLSKKVKRNIERESLRIKAIYETPNAELDKIVAELKEAINNRPIESIDDILAELNIEAKEKLKDFKWEKRNGIIEFKIITIE
jgi:hypothetical protein